MKSIIFFAVFCVVCAEWSPVSAEMETREEQQLPAADRKDANSYRNRLTKPLADLVKTRGDSHKENNVKAKRYKPDWKDLDTRPLPIWYAYAKIGIMLHWGVYSVPSFDSEWFWWYWKNENNTSIAEFMEENYPPGFSYQEFAPMFTAEFFDANQWARLFRNAGAWYVVMTTKHHEGFTMFPSKKSFSWNSVDVGPHRDIVGELTDALRLEGLVHGFYHSLYEWYNPIYLSDKSYNFTKYDYPQQKLWPDLKQLVNDYQPYVIWSDGDWEAHDTYWNSTELLAWLYNDSPVKDYVVVNDRWGIGIPCHHGDFYNCEDRYDPGTLQNHKWESAFTIDTRSWGYRRTIDIEVVLDMKDILAKLIRTVSCGGNVLINVGPTKEGTIAPIFQERLLALGDWLKINGEAIYGTSPWLHQNDTINNDVWYTCYKEEYNALRPTAVPSPSDTVYSVYALLTNWPVDDKLRLKDLAPLLYEGEYEIQMLKENHPLTWVLDLDTRIVTIELPPRTQSKYAWALKICKKRNFNQFYGPMELPFLCENY